MASLGLAGLAAGKGESHNFSQYPGFAEYFAANPPADSTPGLSDQALLEKHRPRLFVPNGHAGPIDFYRDYIAHGVLRDAGGTVISDRVTPDRLNSHKDDPGIEFIHHPPSGGPSPSPVMFARIERAPVDLGDGPAQFTFLTYHAVFAQSGLPAGLLP